MTLKRVATFDLSVSIRYINLSVMAPVHSNICQEPPYSSRSTYFRLNIHSRSVSVLSTNQVRILHLKIGFARSTYSEFTTLILSPSPSPRPMRFLGVSRPVYFQPRHTCVCYVSQVLPVFRNLAAIIRKTRVCRHE